jgi:hypothetical protein
MDRKQLVFEILKPKAKDLGFNKNELKGIAAKIADNLTSAEDATDEDLNKEITTAVDNLLPFLQISQSQGNRLLDEWKKSHPTTEEEEEEEQTPPAVKKKPGKTDDETTKKLMGAIAALTSEVKALKDGKTSDSRKDKLAKVVEEIKDSEFAKQTLKSFARMNFKDEDDFEEYLSDITEGVKAEIKAQANKGVEMTPPGSPQKPPKEVLSDDEIKGLADMLG